MEDMFLSPLEAFVYNALLLITKIVTLGEHSSSMNVTKSKSIHDVIKYNHRNL